MNGLVSTHLNKQFSKMAVQKLRRKVKLKNPCDLIRINYHEKATDMN